MASLKLQFRVETKTTGYDKTENTSSESGQRILAPSQDKEYWLQVGKKNTGSESGQRILAPSRDKEYWLRVGTKNTGFVSGQRILAPCVGTEIRGLQKV